MGLWLGVALGTPRLYARPREQEAAASAWGRHCGVPKMGGQRCPHPGGVGTPTTLCGSKCFLMLGAGLGFSGGLGTGLGTDVCWLAGLGMLGLSGAPQSPETVLSTERWAEEDLLTCQVKPQRPNWVSLWAQMVPAF